MQYPKLWRWQLKPGLYYMFIMMATLARERRTLPSFGIVMMKKMAENIEAPVSFSSRTALYNAGHDMILRCDDADIPCA